MPIEPGYRELFSDSVTVYPPVSVDLYGKRTWAGSGSVVAAHLVMEARLDRDSSGREVNEVGRAYLFGDQSYMTTDHLVVLSNGASPVLLTVETPWAEDGPHHTLLRFGALTRG
jgi:hypothetical protein